MESKIHVQESPEENSVTIRVDGSMDLTLYGRLREIATQFADRHGLRYIFDWSLTRHLHDSGVAVLVELSRWVAGQNGAIECVNCGPHILSSFRRTGMLGKFPLSPFPQENKPLAY